jgi:hypothetical protein
MLVTQGNASSNFIVMKGVQSQGNFVAMETDIRAVSMLIF